MGCGSSQQVRVADLHQFEILDYDADEREVCETPTTKYRGLKVGQKLLYQDEATLWIVGEVIKIVYENNNCNVLLHFLSGDEKWIDIASNITKIAPLELLNSYAIDNSVSLSNEQIQNVQYYLEKGTLKRGISAVVSSGIVRKTEFEKELNNEEATHTSQPTEYNQSVSYFKQLMRDDNSCANSATSHNRNNGTETYSSYSSPSSMKKAVEDEFPVLNNANSFSLKPLLSGSDTPLSPAVQVKPTYATVARGAPSRSTESFQPRKAAPAISTASVTPLSPFVTPDARIDRSKIASSSPTVNVSHKEEMIGKAVLMRGYLKSRKLHLSKQEVDALNAIIHFHDKAKNHRKDFPRWVYETYEKILTKYEEVQRSQS